MKKWKMAALVPIVVGMFFITACEDKVLKEIAQNSTNALAAPDEIQARFEQVKKENGDQRYVLVELNETGQSKMDEMEKTYGLPESMEVFTVTNDRTEVIGDVVKQLKSDTCIQFTDTSQPSIHKESKRVFAIIGFNDAVNAISQSAKLEGEVFLVVEEPATPKRGMDVFFKYITDNMQYTSEAVRKGITGKVFVEFVVNSDGALRDIKVLKGIGHGCDEEAVRVLTGADHWTPGKQRGIAVAQRMVLPITFTAPATLDTAAMPAVEK